MLGIKILICDDMSSDPICYFPMWEVFKKVSPQGKGDEEDYKKDNKCYDNCFHNIKISKKV